MQTLYPKSPKLNDDSFLRPSGEFKIHFTKVIGAIGLFQEFSNDILKTFFNEYTGDASYYLIVPELQEENFLKFYDLVVECFEALNAAYFTALKILADFQSEVIEKSHPSPGLS